MKKHAYFSILLVCLFSASLFAGDAVDFSGTWTLDESKVEDTGGGPNMAAGKIVVKQDDKTFSSDRFLSNEMMGDFTVTVNVTLNGEETKSEEQFGTRVSTATWSEDKKSLTINSTMFMSFDGQDMEMKSVEVWSIEKKNVIKLETTFEGPMGTMESTNYYNKAE